MPLIERIRIACFSSSIVIYLYSILENSQEINNATIIILLSVFGFFLTDVRKKED